MIFIMQTIAIFTEGKLLKHFRMMKNVMWNSFTSLDGLTMEYQCMAQHLSILDEKLKVKYKSEILHVWSTAGN